MDFLKFSENFKWHYNLSNYFADNSNKKEKEKFLNWILDYKKWDFRDALGRGKKGGPLRKAPCK